MTRWLLKSFAAGEAKNLNKKADYTEPTRKNTRPRSHVMDAYLASHEKYSELYKKLAK